VEGLDELAYERVDPAAEGEQIARLEQWREERDQTGAKRALDQLRKVAATADNLLPASIEAVKAGVTTGEWADALREAFGEFRAPTGVGARIPAGAEIAEARERVTAAAQRLGVKKLRLLIAKPGLDGHSNAAEQISVRARDAGFEVIYQGIRLTPQQIAAAALEEDVHAIGLSILSGAHNLLVPDVLERLRGEGVDLQLVPVIVGGIIPADDETKLLALGVARIYTPKDFDMTKMIAEIADLIAP
jgi:(2R)-ethylmalonyl-CoA mutase